VNSVPRSGERPLPAPSDKEQLLTTAQAQADALGVSRWTIHAARRAGRELGDPLGRFATRRWLFAWFRRHPDFVASRWLGKNAKPPCTSSNRPPEAAGTLTDVRDDVR
jgi:hypothetical protein